MAERTLDVELIRQLAELLDKTSLTEIEVEDEGVRIRVARTAAAVAAPAPAVIHHAATPLSVPSAGVPAPAEIGASAPAAPVNAVKSPMVGTVYLAGEPGAKPFVAPGQQVAAGDTLLIVEAMKVLNPITAPSAGTVREVLVANGQPVEFDQPLVVLD